jgi:hypothetical protein
LAPCTFIDDCKSLAVAAVAMQIEKGHFGSVSLDGLKWVGVFAGLRRHDSGVSRVFEIARQ